MTGMGGSVHRAPICPVLPTGFVALAFVLNTYVPRCKMNFRILTLLPGSWPLTLRVPCT